MNGIELCTRFSYITNNLCYCGPDGASKTFLEYAKDPSKEEEVKRALLKFEALPPYFSVIAERNHRELFDTEVVEAYWLGNALLDACTFEDCKAVIRKLMQRGLPKSIGEELILNVPKGMVPHHNFNVFYVGVGRTSGKVPTNLQTMDNCRISWGKVLLVWPEHLYVETQTLEEHEGKIHLKYGETKTAIYLKEYLPGIKPGDTVAMHWGFAGMVLTGVEKANLERYTLQIISLL